MATDSEPATRDQSAAAAPPPARGRGRGGRGRGGRGRGGGRGASQAAGANKTTTSGRGRGGVRRGRAKNFSDSRVQAAYERQRDLKSVYQIVTAAVKPALQELAERNVDEILADPDKYRNVDEYLPVVSQLQDRLDTALRQSQRRLDFDLGAAEKRYDGDQYMVNQQFQNAVADLFEQFYEGQHNRLRILASLHEKGLPVDVRDDQYDYQVITDEHFDKEFGIYEAYKDGHLVPYPSRVPGTDMWQKARDNDAAAAATALATVATTAAITPAPARGRGRGRGGTKRKPTGDPDGVPTPKRSTRNTTEDLLAQSMAPVPAKGLLASAAEADLPAETPLEDISPDGTPEPSSFMAALKAKMGDKDDDPRLKSPPLPKNINDEDMYKVRLYNAKPSMREKGANSRLLAPAIFAWDALEIGFKDSQNDSSKGHTVAKRGKYLDTPNSNGMHFDHWCIGYDYSKMTEEDFDQELVKKHEIHPKYGIFLPDSFNYLEEPVPYHMPGKPVVFIAEPSGRISHASRGFQNTANHRRMMDDPYRDRVSAGFRRFCKLDGIDMAEVSVNDYLPTFKDLKSRSLGTAQRELESRPVLDESEPSLNEEPEVEPEAEEEPRAEQPEEPCAEIFTLIAASEYIDTQAASAPAPPSPAPPKKQAKYDAIRDIFVTASQPEPQPQPKKRPSRHVANEDATILNILARVCESQEPGAAAGPGAHDRTSASYVGPQHAQEVQAPLSNEREMFDRPPLSNEREVYDRGPMFNDREMYERPPQSTEREMYAPMLYPNPSRPSEAPYPISNERDAPYGSAAPAPYRDPRMSIESHTAEVPRRTVEHIPTQPAYQPARQSEPAFEASPYARQPEPPIELSSYSRQPEPPAYPPRPYEQSHSHQSHPAHATPAPSSEYRHPYGYGPPPDQAGYPPRTQPPYSQHEQRDPREYREAPMPPQGRPYERTFEDRRMSHYSESPTFSRPQWAQPTGQPPPPSAGPGQAPQAPPQPATPSQGSGFSLPPPSSRDPRDPFGAQASSEPLPPLRPPRRSLLGAAAPDEAAIDPAMRQGSQGSSGTFYSSTPSRGFQNNYPPPERMMGTPQQSYVGSPPAPYGPPGGSPTFGTIMMQGSPDQGQGVFRHRSSHSGSGPPGGPPGSAAAAAAAAQNSKYRQLQPAPIPAHRSYAAKPDLKTIPYDHKDPSGNTAQLPNSGPTTIRGWQVNPQTRKAQQAAREKVFGGVYGPPANDKEDSR